MDQAIQLDKHPCIGLIGGIAVGASCEYYKRLHAAFAREKLPLHLALIHADLDTALSYLSSRDLDGLGRYYGTITHQLAAAGATMAAITSVASHMGYAATREHSPVPLISILTAVREEIEAQQLRRVALFGSRFAMESNMYGALEGVVEVIQLSRDERTLIDTLYMNFARNGVATAAEEQQCTALAHAVIEREHLDAVILAGTDLAVVYNGGHRPSFPYVDATDAHVAALLQATKQQHAAASVPRQLLPQEP